MAQEERSLLVSARLTLAPKRTLNRRPRTGMEDAGEGADGEDAENGAVSNRVISFVSTENVARIFWPHQDT